MAESNIQLKLLVHSKTQRVVFAEADKKFTDFLLTLFSLPLGTVIRLLKTHSSFGCLANLYHSVEGFKDSYLQPNQTKDNILNPKLIPFSYVPALLNNVDSQTAPKFYVCSHKDYTHYCCEYFANDPKAICPRCKNCMSREGQFVQEPIGSTDDKNGGFVKDAVTFIVMYDLSLKPMSTISCIALMNELKIKEVDDLVEKVVTLDVNEGVRLLKASLESKTVLTDVLLRKMEKA